jgi:hypothetical protein
VHAPQLASGRHVGVERVVQLGRDHGTDVGVPLGVGAEHPVGVLRDVGVLGQLVLGRVGVANRELGLDEAGGEPGGVDRELRWPIGR